MAAMRADTYSSLYVRDNFVGQRLCVGFVTGPRVVTHSIFRINTYKDKTFRGRHCRQSVSRFIYVPFLAHKRFLRKEQVLSILHERSEIAGFCVFVIARREVNSNSDELYQE